jgi:hypothetical protein
MRKKKNYDKARRQEIWPNLFFVHNDRPDVSGWLFEVPMLSRFFG